MLSDSFLTLIDWNGIGKEQGERQTECTFWTGLEGQLCVQYFRPEADVYYEPHAHSEYTLVFCLEGEVMKNQLGQVLSIGSGEVMIGNHGAEHTSGYFGRNGRACESVSISLDRRLFAVLTRDFRFPVAEGPTGPAFFGKINAADLKLCAEDIAQELRSKREGHKIIIETLAIRVVVETLRRWPLAGVQEVKADSAHRLPRREFIRAYEFMRWCRKEDFRLQHLCRFLGTSEERFTRLFLTSTRQTPASFYNRLLLNRAVDLLGNPKLSVKEVGFELGFKTSSHFIAAFRREFAVSPQEFREQESAGHGRFDLKALFASNPRFSVVEDAKPMVPVLADLACAAVA